MSAATSEWLHGVRVRRLLHPTLGVLGTLTLLESLSRADVLPRADFPPVSEVSRALASELLQSTLWTAVVHTLEGWAIGLAIAVAAAVPLGIVLGSSVMLYRSLRVVIEFLRPIPAVALVPVAILLFGSGLQMKVLLVAFGAFWPVLMQTIYGVGDVEPTAVAMARSFRIRGGRRMLRVVLPSALPYISTGIRVASAIAMILAVTAELVVGAEGLGREILLAQSGGAVERMYAFIVTTGVLGLALNTLLVSLDRRALSWHPRYREAAG